MANRIDRRRFLQVSSLAGLGGAIPIRELLAETSSQTGPKATHAEGTAAPVVLDTRIAHVSGIPLGGIGAGSVEIRPDGYFADWLIFNMGAWSPEQPSTESGPSPDMGRDGLTFFLRTRQSGEGPKLRRLGMREDQNDLYSVAFAKPVQGIEFDSKFPFALLNYIDSSLPVQVTGLAFAPIVPGDARTSGTPGFTVVFKALNTSDRPVELSLLGLLRNPLATGATDRALHNLVAESNSTRTLAFRTTATTGRKSCHGSMALSVSGGRHSHIAGSYRPYLGNGFWGGSRGYGSPHFSFLHEFNAAGELPNTDSARPLDHLLLHATDEGIDSMPLPDLQALKVLLYDDAFFRAFIDRIAAIDSGRLQTRTGLANLAKEARDRLNDMSGADRERSSWGDGALCSHLTLKPGEQQEVRFALSWFFPNHFSKLGPNLGHQYEHWFADAAEVNHFLVQNHTEHRKKTVDFAETALTTDLPAAVAFSWTAQLSTLIKSSWWCRDGRFAVWEGLGCCGLHTTDITYQGSFPIIALFPELQMRQVEMGASFQRQDGRIPHFFSPDLRHVDNGFDRVDMNPQYVMMVCRDYLWSGDRQYLADSFPHVRRAMLSTQRLDGDGDGLPDHDTRRNTYDQWDMEGSPAYICSLWLGALQAAIRLAEDLGETGQKEEWEAVHARARASFITRLWNGEYFDLWVSDAGKDECCMSDQLSGEWYTGLMGLSHSVPHDTIRVALRSIHKNNFDAEAGLRNATYPEGRPKRFRTHQNLQAAANWTGIEYANAALMIEMGLLEEGLQVIEAVHDRYLRAGRVWNHVECGDHYFRAMSSWSSLLALTGLRVDAPRQRLTVAPKLEKLIAPWFLPSGYGVLHWRAKRMDLRPVSGALTLRELRVPVGSVRASLGGKAAPATATTDGEYTLLRFERPVSATPGQTLSLTWA